MRRSAAKASSVAKPSRTKPASSANDLAQASLPAAEPSPLSSNVLGKFGKGVPGAVSINFGVSGGPSCETTCAHHPESEAKNPTRACYAARVENRPDRKTLFAKLLRHDALPPARIMGKALYELQRLVARGKTPTWIRFSTNGSLPKPRNADRLFLKQLRTFLLFAKQHDIPVHIPVESRRKVNFYRKHVGDLAVIRLSLQHRAGLSRTEGAVSITGGTEITSGRQIRERRIEASRELAKVRTKATGRKCVVCPAVVVSFRHRQDKERQAKAKCGNCTACSETHIDIIYPLH